MPPTEPRAPQLPSHGFFPAMGAGFFIGLVGPMLLVHLCTLAMFMRPRGGFAFVGVSLATVFLVWPVLRRLNQRGAAGLVGGMMVAFAAYVVLRGAATSGFIVLFESYFYYLADFGAFLCQSTDWRRSGELDHAAARGITDAFKDGGCYPAYAVASFGAIALQVWFVCRLLTLLGNRWQAQSEIELKKEADLFHAQDAGDPGAEDPASADQASAR